jgi:hypothetical protein
MSSSMPLADEPAVEAVLEAARRTQCSLRGIQGLAAALPADRGLVRSAILKAAAQFEGATGFLLALAASEAGHRLALDETAALLPLAASPLWIPILVGRTEGSPVRLAQPLKAIPWMEPNLQAMTLYVISLRCPEVGLPPVMRDWLIQLATNRKLTEGGAAALAEIAHGCRDPEVRAAVAGWQTAPSAAGAADQREVVGELLDGRLPDPLMALDGSVFPGDTPPRLPGSTPARNAPCPCGSGLKYKRCCAGAKGALASPAATAPAAGELDNASKRNLKEMSLPQLARLSFGVLSTVELIGVHRRFSWGRMWDKAEETMELLAKRRDCPGGGNGEGHREDFVADALHAKAAEVAGRQLEKMTDRRAAKRLAVELAILAPTAATLRVMDEHARAVLAGEASDCYGIAYSMLDHFPGLGIFFARGLLDEQRAFDSRHLTEEIEDARHQLRLSPGDPIAEAFLRRFEAEEQPAPHASAPSRDEPGRQAAELAELRTRLRKADSQLRKMQSQLDKAHETAGQTPTPKLETGPSALEQAAARAELRDKIAGLKSLVAEGQAERAALRRRVTELECQPARDPAPRSPETRSPETRSPETPASEGTEPFEVDEPAPAWSKLLVPVFSPRARDGLEAASTGIAARAIRTAASLATGEPSAWCGIKRLQGRQNLWSARIGLHHRLLFRLQAERAELELVAFVTREELDTELRRLS